MTQTDKSKTNSKFFQNTVGLSNGTIMVPVFASNITEKFNLLFFVSFKSFDYQFKPINIKTSSNLVRCNLQFL